MTLPPQSHDEDAAEDGGRTQDKAQGDGLAHEDHRPQGRDDRHAQLGGGSGRDTVTGHQRIPEDIAQGGGQGPGAQGQRHPLHRQGEPPPQGQHQHQDQGDAADEVVGGGLRSVTELAAAQAVGPPGGAGHEHHAGGRQGRRFQTGQQQDHEPGHGQAYPQRLPQVGALPRMDPITYHAGLHGHGDDQGPGRGGHAHIGDGKRQHVGEQRQGRAPAALPPPVRHLSVTPLAPSVQGKEHQSAGRHADGRITDRIHAVMQQGKAAQDGVEGKKGHAQQGQERQRQPLLPGAACRRPCPRYGSFRIRHLFSPASQADATAIQKKSFANDKQNPYLRQNMRQV